MLLKKYLGFAISVSNTNDSFWWQAQIFVSWKESTVMWQNCSLFWPLQVFSPLTLKNTDLKKFSFILCGIWYQTCFRV